MVNYKIISVNYSLKTEITDSEAMDFTNKVGVPHKEVVYLMAHVLFKYTLGHQVFEGECIYPVATVCTVVYTEVASQIKATQFIKGDSLPTKAELEDLAEQAVEVEYKSSIIEQLSLGINYSYTAILNKRLLLDNESSPAPTSYQELDNWHSGIGRGADEINQKYPDDYYWEYPVLTDGVLSITQAYYAQLNSMLHQLDIE